MTTMHRVGRDISVLADCLEVPGIGFLPVNAFVLHAEAPVVVDTGLGLPDRNFLEVLGSAIDPAEVRWVWLTHPDRDHTGGLFALLDAAPQARVVTTYIGAGIMSTERPLPRERVFLLNPGQSLDVGDRTLSAFRPPLFDNPATVGFYDDRSRACFSSDCFGAPMPSADLAEGDDAGGLVPEQLRAAQLLWATVDSPWVHAVDTDKYLATVRPLREMDPETVLSTHLPVATGLTSRMVDSISAAPGADPFMGPDQRELERMLAGFEPGGPAPGPVAVPEGMPAEAPAPGAPT
ncbi:MBL fold metallo-hydrolase [Streptomyces sp. WAC05374]|uniref:MBL fold metallo-hydrolase n=2 Tax=Streptomyces sp. WAC05374 TaxID=2487420 RepID=UPI000F897106|nr:MBL fold metallo-hydrolase [Streptomyces sp. WAC05374]RST15571.1 MBL fold metallo-hydrolase [Streptomyces sp. WAC05374]TDF50304.1 MBL fold metallo-hydrolase [Streptomyces sp. WAC05374]TDF58028.1 MBL fold metallo-hydrolase [Streptomyces sp. WAC05374]TDF60556.1 MBL fold metallo-hydrolase [Streptomyces sp. WAC05374]